MERLSLNLAYPEAPVLIVTPQGRDAEGASLLLTKAGISNRTYPSVEMLCLAINEEVGALVIAEEAIHAHNLPLLTAQLEQQPLWSDLPIIILTRAYSSNNFSERSATSRLAEVLGNTIFLERPLHSLTLISAVRSGLKARTRQFQLHKYILDREQVAEELRKSERKLAESNRELERFAAIVSHDLQAPLRKVIIFSDYLAQSMKGTLTAENLDYFNRIQRAVERMQQLITDLLTLSRVTRRTEPFIPTDLEKVLTSVLDELHLDIKESGGRVDVECLQQVEADPKQMHQLFVNLISNALKYKRPGIPPIIKVYCEQEKDLIRLIVEDNGIGIKKEHQERIFEIFQRLHSAEEYSGTGIGLAIVRRIVERHGGTIRIVSQVDEGSRFIVELPRKHMASSTPEALALI